MEGVPDGNHVTTVVTPPVDVTDPTADVTDPSSDVTVARHSDVTAPTTPYYHRNEVTMPIRHGNDDVTPRHEPNLKQPHYLSTANLNIKQSLENHSNLEVMSRNYRSTSRLNGDESPGSGKKITGVENEGFEAEEADVKSTFDHSKPYNEKPLTETVNLELINMKPPGVDVVGNNQNGVVNEIPMKKDEDVEIGNPYDEYFVPVNEHRKYMRGEKLYVTVDKRNKKSRSKCLCWTVCLCVVIAALVIGILAAVGAIGVKQPISARHFSGEATPIEGAGLFADVNVTSPAPPTPRRFVKRALEAVMAVDNAPFSELSTQKNDSEDGLEAELKNAIFAADYLRHGSAEINLKIVDVWPGAVRFRVGWSFKPGVHDPRDPVTVATLQRKLQHVRQLANRHVTLVNVTMVTDQCDQLACEQRCQFDYSATLQFVCACADNQRVAADGKTCVLTVEPEVVPEPEVRKEEIEEPQPEPEVKTEESAKPEPEPEVGRKESEEPGVGREESGEPEPEPEVRNEEIEEPQPEPEAGKEESAKPEPEPEVEREESAKLKPEPEVREEEIAEPKPEPEVRNEEIEEPQPEPEVETEESAKPEPEPEAGKKESEEDRFEPEVRKEEIAEPKPEPEVKKEEIEEPKAEPEAGREESAKPEPEPEITNKVEFSHKPQVSSEPQPDFHPAPVTVQPEVTVEPVRLANYQIATTKSEPELTTEILTSNSQEIRSGEVRMVTPASEVYGVNELNSQFVTTTTDHVIEHNMSPFLPDIENDTLIGILHSDGNFIGHPYTNSEPNESSKYNLANDQLNHTNPLDVTDLSVVGLTTGDAILKQNVSNSSDGGVLSALDKERNSSGYAGDIEPNLDQTTQMVLKELEAIPTTQADQFGSSTSDATTTETLPNFTTENSAVTQRKNMTYDSSGNGLSPSQFGQENSSGYGGDIEPNQVQMLSTTEMMLRELEATLTTQADQFGSSSSDAVTTETLPNFTTESSDVPILHEAVTQGKNITNDSSGNGLSPPQFGQENSSGSAEFPGSTDPNRETTTETLSEELKATTTTLPDQSGFSTLDKTTSEIPLNVTEEISGKMTESILDEPVSEGKIMVSGSSNNGLPPPLVTNQNSSGYADFAGVIEPNQVQVVSTTQTTLGGLKAIPTTQPDQFQSFSLDATTQIVTNEISEKSKENTLNESETKEKNMVSGSSDNGLPPPLVSNLNGSDSTDSNLEKMVTTTAFMLEAISTIQPDQSETSSEAGTTTPTFQNVTNETSTEISDDISDKPESGKKNMVFGSSDSGLPRPVVSNQNSSGSAEFPGSTDPNRETTTETMLGELKATPTTLPDQSGFSTLDKTTSEIPLNVTEEISGKMTESILDEPVSEGKFMVSGSSDNGLPPPPVTNQNSSGYANYAGVIEPNQVQMVPTTQTTLGGLKAIPTTQPDQSQPFSLDATTQIVTNEISEKSKENTLNESETKKKNMVSGSSNNGLPTPLVTNQNNSGYADFAGVIEPNQVQVVSTTQTTLGGLKAIPTTQPDQSETSTLDATTTPTSQNEISTEISDDISDKPESGKKNMVFGSSDSGLPPPLVSKWNSSGSTEAPKTSFELLSSTETALEGLKATTTTQPNPSEGTTIQPMDFDEDLSVEPVDSFNAISAEEESVMDKFRPVTTTTMTSEGGHVGVNRTTN